MKIPIRDLIKIPEELEFLIPDDEINNSCNEGSKFYESSISKLIYEEGFNDGIEFARKYFKEHNLLN